MAVFDSPATTYSDTTPHKRSITDYIALLDPSDSPLVDRLGGLDGAQGKFRFTNWPTTKPEWLEDGLAPLTTTMAAASITADTTSFSVTDASIFEPGHIIEIESELMWISARNVTTNLITVTRGVAGSTTATHTSSCTVTIVSQARLEGADSDYIAMVDRSSGSNYTQIFHHEVKVTRSHEKLLQYGITSEMAYQVDKAMPEIMRLIETGTFKTKASDAGSATTPRIMGGIQAFISTNKLDGSSLTQAKIENALMSCYNAGASGPWMAPCAPATMQKIKNFYDNTIVLRVDRSETTVGMEITQIHTPFGDLNLFLDRWCPTTLLPIISENDAGFLTYDPFFNEPLAKDGDYEKSELIGEFTFCMRLEKAHALLTAVS